MLKVYITDLAAYNQGFLIGEWVELPMAMEDLENKVLEILKKGSIECGFNEEHEEIFITDFEWEGTQLFKVEEYSNLEEINYKCEQLEDLSEDDQKRMGYLMDYVGFNFEDALERYEEVSIYENTTLEQVVEDYIYETINMDEIPDIIKNNIDFKGIAYDFEISGEYDKVDGDIYHFVN
jgi:uncharacterized FlaG/YvyC family protein